jgi:hypothetical protein
MSVTAHVFPTLSLNALKKTLDVSTETLQVLLVAPGTAYTWNSTSQGHTHVSDFLGGSGAGSLTEVSTSGTGYTRQALTSVTLTTVSSLVTVLTCANPTWSSATLSATYALFYDNTGGSDSARQVLGYWDFGSTQTVTSAPFVLTVNSVGLFTWSHS